jgi:hypothetical protein
MFSGHPNIRNALYLQPPQTHAAVFFTATSLILQLYLWQDLKPANPEKGAKM